LGRSDQNDKNALSNLEVNVYPSAGTDKSASERGTAQTSIIFWYRTTALETIMRVSLNFLVLPDHLTGYGFPSRLLASKQLFPPVGDHVQG
jgi:hypothetical protein